MLMRLDPRNPHAVSLGATLSDRLEPAALPSDLCIVIGGDGWMLSCIRELGPDYIYLGLNRGHLGFLLNDIKDIETTAADINANLWQAHSFPRLQLNAHWQGESITTTAVNDMYAERMTGQTAHLRVSLQGMLVVERLVCDGILVSTALGSTAYAFSAGGVPCHPLVRAIQLTPICPHSPRLSPIVLPPDANIIIEVLTSDKRPVRAVADGIDQGRCDRLHIGPAKSDIRLAFFKGHHFTRTMVEKVIQS